MTTTALLMKEIETMPEETATQLLDFAVFLKSKHPSTKPHNKISIKDAYGIFKGIDTHFERDENDRV